MNATPNLKMFQHYKDKLYKPKGFFLNEDSWANYNSGVRDALEEVFGLDQLEQETTR